MIKPDIIVAYPRHLIFPLWNKYIRENRDRFAKVIVIMTDMSVDADYTQYLKDWFGNDNITIVANDPVAAKDDWRNVAVNKGLRLSDSKLVIFTEQDFLPNEGFWQYLKGLMTISNVISYFQDGRMHPCFILAPRDIIELTSKNFSAKPPDHDHFGQFQKDIEYFSFYLQDEFEVVIGKIQPDQAVHMNGLSQNLYLLQIGEEPNYRPDDFKEYCRKCLELPDLHPDFRDLFSWYLEK